MPKIMKERESINQYIHADIDNIDVNLTIHDTFESLQIVTGQHKFDFILDRKDEEEPGSVINKFRSLILLSEIKESDLNNE